MFWIGKRGERRRGHIGTQLFVGEGGEKRREG